MTRGSGSGTSRVGTSLEDPFEVKFDIARVPKGYVDRARLTHALDWGAEFPLTLVSAPAGTGKTTLVAAWLSRRTDASDIAWVTFDDTEDESAAFWPDVFEAVRRQGLDLKLPPTMLVSGSPSRGTVTALAGRLAARTTRLTLVLDGCELTKAAVAKDLDFLLRHNGHRLRVILITRVDPVLPLHRYRLDDSLAELRMVDLAFTDREAKELLENEGVHLTRASVRTLNERTKGWAAGLRFAARSLADREDPDAAVLDIAGDTGNIAEYLVAEVLDAQTPQVRQLLLNTSVPDVLQPGLIEELGGRSATRLLALLSHANAFVEPLVEHPGYYRYHPFFRDLLRAELAFESPRRMVRLHRKAARWFANEGLLAPAVGHAAAIHAWQEGARYIVDDLAVGRLLANSDTNLATALGRIPSDVKDPAVAVVRAALALASCDTDRCAQELALTRQKIGQKAAVDQNVVLAADVVEAVHACFAGDSRTAEERATQAARSLAEYPPERVRSHPELTALVQTAMGVATLRSGEFREARKALTAAATQAKAPGCEPLVVESLGYLALIASLQGHLRRARDWANRAISAAEAVGLPAADRPPAAEVALAWLSVEQYLLDEAREHVKTATLSHTLQGDPVARVMLAVVQARLRRTKGDLRGAIKTLQQSREDSAATPGWLTDRLVIEEASVRVAIGEPETAVHEIQALEHPEEAASALVVAQARIEQDADVPLEPLLSQVLVPDAPLQAVVTGRLLEAADKLRLGQVGRARAALDRSLRLAAPESMRRPFHDAPADVRRLLQSESQLTGHSRWLDRQPTSAQPVPLVPRQVRAGDGASPDQIVEALTAKELEVLGHLSELLTTDEIAATMFVSVNTVRTHVRSILRKLAVSRRNEAVRRARELDLIGA